jgi:hypothetical protein
VTLYQPQILPQEVVSNPGSRCRKPTSKDLNCDIAQWPTGVKLSGEAAGRSNPQEKEKRNDRRCGRLPADLTPHDTLRCGTLLD